MDRRVNDSLLLIPILYGRKSPVNKLNIVAADLVKVILALSFVAHTGCSGGGVDPSVSTETAVGAEFLPVDLTGAAPEEVSITVTVNKPSNATNGLITLDVYDADYPDEGVLLINGSQAVTLFGSAATRANNNKSASITLSTPGGDVA